MFSSVPSGNWGLSLQWKLISCKFSFKKEREGMEGVNPQGLLHSMSHPLLSLCLSCTHARTIRAHYSFCESERGKSQKKREEKLQALTNDLING